MNTTFTDNSISRFETLRLEQLNTPNRPNGEAPSFSKTQYDNYSNSFARSSIDNSRYTSPFGKRVSGMEKSVGRSFNNPTTSPSRKSNI